MEEPVVEIFSTSERRVESRRAKEEDIADALEAMRCCFTSAKREGSGVASPPLRDAKTEEISPSFRGPLSRGVGSAAVAIVARVRVLMRGEMRG